jgi:hypothetical protein
MTKVFTGLLEKLITHNHKLHKIFLYFFQSVPCTVLFIVKSKKSERIKYAYIYKKVMFLRNAELSVTSHSKRSMEM